jgi:hypothetical protein
MTYVNNQPQFVARQSHQHEPHQQQHYATAPMQHMRPTMPLDTAAAGADFFGDLSFADDADALEQLRGARPRQSGGVDDGDDLLLRELDVDFAAVSAAVDAADAEYDNDGTLEGFDSLCCADTR